MSMYFVKQGDISESNKPELYPFESKQLPDSKSGLSQFRKTLEFSSSTVQTLQERERKGG